jgi:glycosyltransferase involved in cell wall biosynthesis
MASKSENIHVSVIISSRNRQESLARTLVSLSSVSSSWDIPWELIVVDNSSTDDTQTMLQERTPDFPTQVTILQESRPGLSRARNRGIAHAQGRILAFTDDDMLFTQAWLPGLFAIFDNDPQTGIVAGRTELHDPTKPSLSVRTGTTGQLYSHPSDPFFLSGNNMAILSDLARTLRCFDQRLGAGTLVGSAEDADIAYRALKAGMRGRFAPEALAYHDHQHLTSDEVRRTRFNYAKGAGAFFAKHILRGDSYALRMWYWRISSLCRANCQKSGMRMPPDAPRMLRGHLAGFAYRVLGL